MYLSFYQLDKKPFEITTDPEFLWLSEKHKESLAMLQYGIMENKGCLLLTGEVGTGKTTLIHALEQTLRNDVVMATIYDPRFETIDFFNHLAEAFKMNMRFDSKGTFIRHFNNFLNTTFVRNKKALLVIDEAQRATPEVLEELRHLSNMEKHYTKLINIFFVGQNEFIDMIRGPEFRALRQRIILNFHMGPFTRKETGEYIRHRLQIAGAKKMIFNSAAVDEIYKFSKGYPRLINIVCDLALVNGYVDEAKIIKPDIIKECADNLKIHNDFNADVKAEPSETNIPIMKTPERQVEKDFPRGKRFVQWMFAFFGAIVLVLAAAGFIYYRG